MHRPKRETLERPAEGQRDEQRQPTRRYFKLVQESVDAPLQAPRNLEQLLSIHAIRKNLCKDFIDQIETKINKMHVRPYVRCLLQQAFPVKALYDTGADITCISLETFRNIPVDQRPPKDLHAKDKRIAVASAETLTTCGTYHFDI